ncbi:MAG: hypothetical protein ABFS05_09365 [Bacteroidota bacterium]
MKQYLISTIIVVSMSLHGMGQNAGDALRYSQQFMGGTARYMAMGGSFGALGADLSVLSTNPAGLGMYKSSDFSLTPSVYVGSSSSLYNGFSGSDSRTNFAVANAGYVITKKLQKKADEPGFRYVQFAMGINRLNDFNRRMVMQGENTENSLLDTYVEYANGIDYRDIEDDYNGMYGFDLTPAWWTFLLDIDDTNTNTYYSPIPYGGTLQRKLIDQWGSMNEWNFSMGTNYGELLYLGMSFSIPWIRYYERSTYSEIDIADTIYDFDQFNIYDRLETKGTGFTFKFGFILRPTDFIRIGGAMHTPTWYSMKDSWNSSTESFFDNGDYYKESSPYGNYKYTLSTPMRLQGSLAFLFGTYGLISGEYEYIDYSTAKLRAYDYSFFSENNDIAVSYGKGHNYKVGTEWRSGPFSFRAGYAYYNSPYQDELNDGSKNAYSGGIGFKDKFYYLDFAYVYTKSVEDYYLYGTNNISVNPVVNELTDHRFIVTLGTRF